MAAAGGVGGKAPVLPHKLSELHASRPGTPIAVRPGVWLLLLSVGLWGGLMWGALPGEPWTALGTMLALAIPFVRSAALLRLGAGMGIAFCGGTLLAAQPSADTGTQGGLARITIDINRSSCGTERCTSVGVLRRCVSIDPGSCPPTVGQLLSLSSHEEPPLGAEVTAVARLSPRMAFRTRGRTPPGAGSARSLPRACALAAKRCVWTMPAGWVVP